MTKKFYFPTNPGFTSRSSVQLFSYSSSSPRPLWDSKIRVMREKGKRRGVSMQEGKVKGHQREHWGRDPLGRLFSLDHRDLRDSHWFFFCTRCARMRRASFPFLLPSRSSTTGEREIGAGTVTAPFSHLARPIISDALFLSSLRISQREVEVQDHDGIPRILFNGCVHPMHRILLLENYLPLPSNDNYLSDKFVGNRTMVV